MISEPDQRHAPRVLENLRSWMREFAYPRCARIDCGEPIDVDEPSSRIHLSRQGRAHLGRGWVELHARCVDGLVDDAGLFDRADVDAVLGIPGTGTRGAS